jgi:hypothetical protein
VWTHSPPSTAHPTLLLVHPPQMEIQNQEYGNCIASLEESYANLETQFKESQVNTDQNFTAVNPQLATINSKLARLDDLPAQMSILSTILDKFRGLDSQKQPLHKEGVESSHFMDLHSNSFACDVFLPLAGSLKWINSTT